MVTVFPSSCFFTLRKPLGDFNEAFAPNCFPCWRLGGNHHGEEGWMANNKKGKVIGVDELSNLPVHGVMIWCGRACQEVGLYPLGTGRVAIWSWESSNALWNLWTQWWWQASRSWRTGHLIIDLDDCTIFLDRWAGPLMLTRERKTKLIRCIGDWTLVAIKKKGF